MGFFRVEVKVDGHWIGICSAAFYVRHLGYRLQEAGLLEPSIYSSNIHSKCWFTNVGYKKCKKIIKETLAELKNEYRILHSPNLDLVVYRDKMQVVQLISKEDDIIVSKDVEIKKYQTHIFGLIRNPNECNNCPDNCNSCKCREKVELDMNLTKDQLEHLYQDDDICLEDSYFQIKLDPSHYSTTTTYEYWEGMKFEHITYKL